MKLLALTFAFVMVGAFQARAVDSAPEAAANTDAKEHEVHQDHPHKHGKKCGHKAKKHADHTDYAHDGHKHKVDGDHVDECK